MRPSHIRSTAKQPSITLRCRRTNRKAANLREYRHPDLCPRLVFALGQAERFRQPARVFRCACAVAGHRDSGRHRNTDLRRGAPPKNCEDRGPRCPDAPDHRRDRGDLHGREPPPLVLNRHCAVCDFQPRCRGLAIERDDLSLLSAMTGKERAKCNAKGIFTITQLSYGYRPRRRKRTKPDAESSKRIWQTRQSDSQERPQTQSPGNQEEHRFMSSEPRR